MLPSSFIGSGSADSSAWERDWYSSHDEEEEEEKPKKRRRVKKRKGSAQGSSLFGENCHCCKREASGRVKYAKCSRCPLKYCGGCLLRKHGEDVEEEMQENVRWVCPICRGGCGLGCLMNCCACGPCRKYQELQPAGRLLPSAIKAGFNNLHDYVIHFETGESPEVISRRKEGRGWTKKTGASLDKTVGSNPTWATKRMRSTRTRVLPRFDSKWAVHTTSKQQCRKEGGEPTLRAVISQKTQFKRGRGGRASA